MTRRTVASLTPAPYNPRKITKDKLELLGRSMRRFGDLSGIVKNLTTGNLVGGHQRVKHFNQDWPVILGDQALGKKALDAVGTMTQGYIKTPFGLWTYREVRWPLATEKAANLAANAHGGTFDMTAVAGLLKDLQAAGEDLEITGLGLQAINGLLEEIKEPETPVRPAKPITKLGDLWELGEHRLYCADATDFLSYDALGPDPWRMIWTDPPWNVDVGHGRRKGIANDDMPSDKFAEFIMAAVMAMVEHLEGDIYVVMSAKEWGAIDSALKAAGVRWSATLAWVKDAFVLGRGNYHRRMEPIWYGWPKEVRSTYNGARNQDDVWECPRPRASADHPTMKPTELVARAVLNSSKKGDVVLDPFGGAGSLILAAEQTGRRGRSIELDPGYCDVIVKRWEALTGKKAKRRSS